MLKIALVHFIVPIKGGRVTESRVTHRGSTKQVS